MGTRLDLDRELRELAPNVYYQQPSSVKMAYPCFRYNYADVKPLNADNKVYKMFNKYLVTYISKEHSEWIVDQMLGRFSHCRLDRPYTADNLYHYVFEVYY